MKSLKTLIVLMALSLLAMHTKAQTTVFSESFENTWTVCAYPDGWASDRTCGGSEDGGYSTAWHRNNVTGNNWLYTSGSYSPTAQDGTKSARFHSYGVSNGVSSYLQTPTIDLSTYSVATLGFYYMNSGGTDNLLVQFYDGSTWNDMSTYTTTSGWELKEITISSTYLISTFKIRFKATSDYGTSDIGLDLVYVNGYSSSNVNWTGGTSTDWETASNWSNAAVPDLADNVTIPSGTTYSPAIGASTVAYCNNLTINSGATLTIGNMDISNGSFNIYGDLLNNGNIYHTSDLNTNLYGDNKTIGGTGNFAYNDEYVSFSITDGSSYSLANDISLINQLRLNTNSTFSLGTYDISLFVLSFDDGTLNLNSGIMEIGYIIDYTTGTFNAGTSTVYFNSGDAVWTNFGYSSDDQTINSFTYYNLKVRTNNGNTTTFGDGSTVVVGNDLTIYNPGTAGGTATTAYDVTIANNFYLGNSGNALTLNMANQMYRASGTGIFTMGNVSSHAINASYNSSSNYAMSGFGTPTYYGTFTYNGTGAQKVIPAIYNNLTSTNSGIRTLYGNIDVNGDMSLTGGNFIQDTYQINVAGNWTSTGNYYEEGSGEIVFDGTGLSTITGSIASFGIADTDTLANENFSSGSIPGTWSQSADGDYSVHGVIWKHKNSACTSRSISTTTNANGYLIVDSDCDGGSGMTTGNAYLTTSTYDCSSYSNVTVSFSHYYYHMSSSSATLEINIDGGGWSTVNTWTSSSANPQNYSVAVPSADGAASVQFRFKYYGDWDWYWAIDDFMLTGENGVENYTGEVFNSYTINKTGGGSISLASKVLINTSLTFTDGLITSTSSFYPEFNTDATVAGTPSGTCHVNGYAAKRTNSITKFTFPVGDGTFYRSIAVTPSGTGSTTWLAKYFPATYSDLTTISIDHVSEIEYWTLDRSGASPSNSTVELSWNENSGVDEDYLTDMVVAHYDGADWESAGGNNITGNASTGTIESNANWSDYSPFTLGSPGGGVPLPVTLLEFTAKKGEIEVLINWTTASEINCDYFTIERSLDGINFEYVGNVNGAGNSSSEINYQLIDREYSTGINYYRLIQTDYNGQNNYSNMVAVDMGGSEKVFIMTVNSIGQEVNSNYKGLVFDIFSDGTSVKRFQ